jgi:outer membrane immunogenic protein
MGRLRTLAVTVVALWALGAQCAPAGADGPIGNPDDPYRYTPYDPAPSFLPFDWSGFYIGGQLGWGYANAESSDSVFDPFVPLTRESLNFSQTGSSVTGGVQGGWQRQWGHMVAGAEVAYTSLRFDGSKLSPLSGLSSLVPLISRSVELRDIFTLTGRLGYADDRWLAYAKGGWANAEVSASYSLPSTGIVTSSSSGRENGWTAGLGADYALLPNLFLGIEYNYMNVRTGIIPPSIAGGQFGHVSVDVQTVVARLNYRFAPRP